VSFEHSRTSGKEQSAPTVAQYQIAMKAFHTAYPTVKLINTWNEVNACQKGSRTERQPRGICKASKAKLLPSTTASAAPSSLRDDHSSTCRRSRHHRRPPSTTSRRSEGILEAAVIWGLHNYSDTNRFSQVRTKAILRRSAEGQGLAAGDGGQLTVFGGSESAKAKKAAKALGCMFYIASIPRRSRSCSSTSSTGAKAGRRSTRPDQRQHTVRRATHRKSRKASKCG